MQDTYKFIQALPADNPSPDAKEYVEGIMKNADETTIQRLIYGNFEYDNDPAKIMDYEKILDCFRNTHVPTGRKCITADIARFGNDKSVIGGWNGFRLERIKVLTKESLETVGQEIEQMRYSMGIGVSDVLADEDGMGGGIIDFMKFKGFVNNSSPLPSPENQQYKQNFDNLKSQCSFGMADIVNKNELYLDVPEWVKPLIIQEMEQVKQKAMDNDQKKGVVSKDKIKEKLGRSPDFWDMIMMRYWFELKPRFKMSAVAV